MEEFYLFRHKCRPFSAGLENAKIYVLHMISRIPPNVEESRAK
jgi:hypothetical protein